MNIYSMACFVANNLKTRYEGKKHGGYNIYEDNKISISYDTYFPNLSIYVKKDGEWVCVYSQSGHGDVSIHKSGAWEKYIENELIPKAQDVKYASEQMCLKRDEEEAHKKFGPINDQEVFS